MFGYSYNAWVGAGGPESAPRARTARAAPTARLARCSSASLRLHLHLASLACKLPQCTAAHICRICELLKRRGGFRSSHASGHRECLLRQCRLLLCLEAAAWGER